MKETLIAPNAGRSTFPINFENLPFACLLGLASLLALAGGIATSALFFGLLLSFALLLQGCRRFGSTQSQTAVQLRSK